MKSALAALALLAATSTAALAGGTVVPVEPPVIPPAVEPAFNWTGAYAGLGIGHVRGEHTYPVTPTLFPDSRGWALSGLVGYNWQGSGPLVVGGELMLSGGRVSATAPCTNPAFDCTSRIGSMAAARLRVGVAADRTLFFVTAGVARANIRISSLELATDTLRTSSHSVNGTTLGIGIEHAMLNGWNVRGDLEAYRFGDIDVTLLGTFPDVSNRATAARLTLVRRF